jgi:RHS repeat-associated protein
LLATYQYSGSNWTFALNDWLGTKRVVVNANGTQAEACTGYPFGDGMNCSGTGGDPSPQHFTGKVRDVESNNDYFGARYYSNNTGRFLVPDWSKNPQGVPYADFSNPQSLNLYGYVANNPLSKTDKDGHCCDWDSAIITTTTVTGGFIGGVLGGGSGAGAGSLVAPGVGTIGGGFEGAVLGSTGGALLGAGLGNGIVGALNAVFSSDKPSTLAPGPNAGEGIPSRSGDRNFTPDERAATNAEGADKGCHTCGTTDPGTKSGNFVPDHQPPTSLNPAGGKQRLYPQCIGCSRTQGGEANAAKRQTPAPPPPPDPQPKE